MLGQANPALEHGVVIRARGLSKIYREGAAELRALSDVDLDIHSGQLTLLMGPSGSGKTTLLSILGCILGASSGRLELLGEEVTSLPEKELPRIRRELIGFVFQGFNLFPTLRAIENVALAMDVRGIRGAEARRRAGELLVEVNLEDRMEAFPRDLSGGQKQRVAIARALAGDNATLDDLDLLLDLTDSQITYRARYLVGLALTPVRDMVVLDPFNTRSLAFQVVTLKAHLDALPSLVEDGMLEPPGRILVVLATDVETTDAGDLTPARMGEFEDALLKLSGAIGDRYFLQGANAAPTVKLGGLA